MNGMGGDNVWLIYDGRRGELLGLSAAGRSAAAADVERYRARYGVSMPTRGGAAALTVPGAVSGWWEMHSSTSLRLEARFDAGVAESLARRGHDVRVVDAWSDLMRYAQVIQIAGDELRGGSDPRADGAARGG